MRVHHLEITAFGPFAQTQTVDLGALGDAGLFLISGPTGSGKTSLLDAVSFALFGSVPGTRVPKLLRSQHADVDVAPRVVLEVTLRGRRFRIRRSPSYERPGRKTAVQASVTLDELVDGAWTHLTNRLDEAGRILEDVLGMTADQFHRVVVLPQGDFAAFLHASNDERGALLRRLFDVQTFADVESWLVEERKHLAARSRDAHRDLERVRHSLVRVLSTLPDETEAHIEAPHAWVDLSGQDLVDAVTVVDDRVQQSALAALTAADTTGAAHGTAERVLTEARSRASHHDRGTAAQTELIELESTAADHAARLARLDLADRATRALASQAALERAGRRRREAETESDRCAAAVGAGLGARDDDGVAAWLDHLTEQDATVDELMHEARRWHESSQQIPALATEVDDVTGELARLLDERTELAARREAAVRAVADARQSGQELEQLTLSAQTLTTRIERRSTLDELRGTSLHEAGDQVRDARDRAQAAREAHQDLIRQRLDDMAGELAERLSPGDPCLVCGSREHPVPARRSSGVDDAALEAAEAVWQDAQAVVDERRTLLAALRATAEQLDQALADEPRDLATLLRDGETLGEQIAQVQAAASTLPAAESDLAALDAALATIESRETLLGTRLTRATSLHDAALAQLTESQSGISRLLTEHDECPCRQEEASPADPDHPEALLELATTTRADHDTARARAQALQQARRSLAEASVLVREEEAARDRALAAERIDSVEEAAAAVLDTETRAELAQRVATYTERRAVVTAALADPDVTAALEQPRPDVDALTQSLDQARARWQQATSFLAQVQHGAREVSEHRRQITALVDETGPLTERLELVAELADLASGRGEDNADGIALTTYVLAVRLERIVALANERLTTMADGRYELEVDHGRADRRTRGGLGLLVLDQWTGAHRPATTLSGGETFMVALALALGTADAVREESGGVDLQTLFIDEGFGSLDEAALEQVLTVLDDLRSGGRSVGVISHVADMRQRIPAQLRVTKTSTGSTVKICLDVDDAA